MCSWLSAQLSYLAWRTEPFNPADIMQMTYNARDVDSRLSALAQIAFNLSWHVDADLDDAWQGIQDYANLPPRQIADEGKKARDYLSGPKPDVKICHVNQGGAL